mmetsp:Transcript_37652/g.111374  ORF Transcript_37652/g.111374 Transcript_37652/m.111374 type:complete len:372 (-) Transcript_37652:2622-3737(-)
MSRMTAPAAASSSSRTNVLVARTHLAARRRVAAAHAVSWAGPSTAPVQAAPTTLGAALNPASELGWRTDFSDVYLRGKMIGAGSFGQVHLGIDQESGLEVAIKTLPKVRGKLSRERTLDKISRETEMLERLQSCPGVIRLLECFEDSASVQIVTELCPGGDLQKFVETYGPLDEASMALVAFEVLKIIKACHDMGILHGDVKPANFCLTGVKRNLFKNKSCSNLRAIDFGCSQFLGGRRLTKRTGTPVFMAPEIFARNYGAKADIWGVGVMLYWLFSKRFPFFENVDMVKQARLDEVAYAVGQAPISFDWGPWQQMSPQGLDFVSHCLSRDEGERLCTDAALMHPWLEKYIAPEELEAVCCPKLMGVPPAA